MGVRVIRLRHPGTPQAAACRWCGFSERDHAGRWVPSRGWHAYERPTREQVRARLAAWFRHVRWERSTW